MSPSAEDDLCKRATAKELGGEKETEITLSVSHQGQMRPPFIPSWAITVCSQLKAFTASVCGQSIISRYGKHYL